MAGDADRGPAWLNEGIAIWRELGDVAELAYALEALGWVFFAVGGNRAVARGLRGESRASAQLRRCCSVRCARSRGVCQMLVAEGEVDRAEPLSRQLLELGSERATGVRCTSGTTFWAIAR